MKKLMVGSYVTIQGKDGTSFHNAEIIGTGKDGLDGTRDVFNVQHHLIARVLQFYQLSDVLGRRYMPGDARFWIE